MKKYSVVTCSIVLCAGMLFNGCGEKKQPNQTADTMEQTTQNDKKENIALRLWGSEQDEELLQEMIESFKKAYVNEANLEVTFEAKQEAECLKNVLGDITNAPDVFTFADDQLRALLAGGVLEPIKYEEETKENNIPASVEAASLNGSVYAYPITADNGYFMYYNKKYFSEEDVKSLDKMLEIADKAGKKVYMDWSSGWYIYSFFGNTGLSLTLNEDGVTNTCDWNSTKTEIKGIDVAKSMLSISKHKSFISDNGQVFVEGIKNETIIAGVSGTWDASEIEQSLGKNYGAVKMPTYNCGGKQVQMASYAGYKMMGVNSYSANREWAEKLANWIASEDNQKLRFVKRAQGPSNIKAAESDEVKNSLAINAVLAQSEYASLQRVGQSYWDASNSYGTAFIEKKVKEQDLQKLLDKMVKGITSQSSDE